MQRSATFERVIKGFWFKRVKRALFNAQALFGLI